VDTQTKMSTSNGACATAEAAVKVEVPKKIKSIVLSSTGSGSDYSNLKLLEEDYPKMEQDSDMCIVRIKAVGLNFAELMQRQGLYKPATKTPYTPGFEGSGIVEAIGNKVTDIKVNDRVLVYNASGIWKDVVCLPKENLIRIPEKMPFEDAAGLLVNYLTAYQMLFRLANIKEGESILIHMAAGGVGTAAVQLCKMIPNVTVFGTASASKHEFLKQNGVNYPIDYTTVDYVDEVKKICPTGIDVVLDPLNGEHSIKGFALLKPMGRIVHFGCASMTTENRSLVNAFKAWWKCLTITSIDIITENKSVSGYHLSVNLACPETRAICIQDMAKIIMFYEQGSIKIVRDSVFSFSKIGEAMKRMHGRKNIGKIILVPDCEIEAATPEVFSVLNAYVGTINNKKQEKEAKETKEKETKEKEAKEKEAKDKEAKEKEAKELKETKESEAKEKAKVHGES